LPGRCALAKVPAIVSTVRHLRSLRPALGAVLGCALLLVGLASPATADEVATLRARAAALAEQIDAGDLRIQVLAERYDQARALLASLDAAVAADAAALRSAERRLAAARALLRTATLEAYLDGGTPVPTAFALGGGGRALLAQGYEQAVAGSLAADAAALVLGERELRSRAAALHRELAAQATTARALAGDRLAAEAVTAKLEADLAQVKGRLAAAVAAEEAAQAAAVAAAAPASFPSTPPPPPAPLVAPGGDQLGMIAVRAAESQLGVPYVWGGATPGVGFDCSGLTMWAWAQAGVQLSHGATAQYYEIEHIPLSDLQPGDLVFYGDAGFLYHVVMYIGGGQVIQAEQTGTDVMITPLPPDPFGAGRP
jgi:cell wall-associated NlpC family hydrolase